MVTMSLVSIKFSVERDEILILYLKLCNDLAIFLVYVYFSPSILRTLCSDQPNILSFFYRISNNETLLIFGEFNAGCGNLQLFFDEDDISENVTWPARTYR